MTYTYLLYISSIFGLLNDGLLYKVKAWCRLVRHAFVIVTVNL